jgi:membrane-associated protein
MHSLFDFLKNLHDSGHLQALIHQGGIPLIALIVFAETGLLVGFFLPGDTMLFVAGVAAATSGVDGQTYLNIWALTISLIAAAIVGDQLGYFLGYQTGHAIFNRPDGLIFKRKHAERAHAFYTTYGVKAVIAARFMPVLRTFVPFMAGVGEMPYPKFLLVDSIGGFSWIVIVVWSGYLLGTRAQHSLHLIIPAIALVSMLPVIIGVAKEVLTARRAKN